MPKSTSINWEQVEVNLDQAPEYFLQTANKLWRDVLSERRRHKPHKSEKDVRGGSIRKDAEQQACWKEAYNSATEELLYFGEFTDKNERIRLLQRVKVVKRTDKQVHIVAAYTLYFTTLKHGGEPILWSARPDGDLFGNFYTDWRPVTRYRLCRISKARLFKPSVLDLTQGDDQDQDEISQAWKNICCINLFSDEREYAEWHLVRYEGANYESKSSNTCAYYPEREHPALYVILGLSMSATQDEIKTAYRRQVMKHHPDRGGKASNFHKLKEAYDELNSIRGEIGAR